VSMPAAEPSIGLSRFTWRDAALWSAAGAAVLVMHLAIAYTVGAMRPTDADGSPPPALMIELAPLPVAPATEEEAVVPDEALPEQAEPVNDTEKVAELEPDPVIEPDPEPVVKDVAPIAEETEPVEELTETPVETVEPTEQARAEPVQEQEPLEEVIPDVVEAVTPEVAVPLPEPRPVEAEKPKAAEKKPVEKAKQPPKKEKKQPAVKPKAAAKVEAMQAPKAAAQQKAEGVSSPRVSPAKWQAKVKAWLDRHKRYPSGARSKGQKGTVQVAFTIDPSGRVTSSRITRSSGNPELDKAALDMLRRASPVPAPPKEIAKASMPISIPVNFNLR